MKVFVTGATGFVGQAVVRALSQRNHVVIGLVRDAHKGQVLEQLGATLVVGDMLEPLQKGQLRIFGKGQNYWSIVHVDDLAVESDAYGQTYNIVDDQPLKLYDLVNTFTDAMDKKRVGSMAPWLLKLIIGEPLVESLVTSSRISNEKAKRNLGWQPRYRTFNEGLPGVLKALEATGGF